MSETIEVNEMMPAGDIGLLPSNVPEGPEMDVVFKEGMRYLTGDGDVDASEENALKSFLRAAALGSIPALVNAGMLYEQKEQYDEALELYEKAAAAGSADGAYNIAMMYLAERGIRKDLGKAQELLLHLYDCGMRGMTCLWLGDFEREGVFGDPNYDKALLYYEDGMRDGCGACFNQAGYMFATGQGVEKDMSRYTMCPECGHRMRRYKNMWGDWDGETYFCDYCSAEYDDFDEDESGERLSVSDAADIWASNGKDEDYTFGYSEEEVEAAL